MLLQSNAILEIEGMERERERVFGGNVCVVSILPVNFTSN